MTRYTLFDGSRPIRTTDNVEGLKLSALFHVNNGDRVFWERTDEPVQVAMERGTVNGKLRFCIAVLD